MSTGEPEYSDVLIIGAGFSGIGAAYRIRETNPHLSYAVQTPSIPHGNRFSLDRKQREGRP